MRCAICGCSEEWHAPNTYEDGISDPVPVICVWCMCEAAWGKEPPASDYEHEYVTWFLDAA